MYAKLPVEKETPRGIFILYLISAAVPELAGIALTGDAFNLYVLIEVAALTGYGLIAIGSNRAAADLQLFDFGDDWGILIFVGCRVCLH